MNNPHKIRLSVFLFIIIITPPPILCFFVKTPGHLRARARGIKSVGCFRVVLWGVACRCHKSARIGPTEAKGYRLALG